MSETTPAPREAVPSPTPMPAGVSPAVAHLFRHSLRQGRIHPLMPLLLRHRQAGQDGGES